MKSLPSRVEFPSFENIYYHCGQQWQDEWSCQCNDRCPVCGCEIEPYESVDLTTGEVIKHTEDDIVDVIYEGAAEPLPIPYRAIKATLVIIDEEDDAIGVIHAPASGWTLQALHQHSQFVTGGEVNAFLRTPQGELIQVGSSSQ
jgi:hypothetical protein